MCLGIYMHTLDLGEQGDAVMASAIPSPCWAKSWMAPSQAVTSLLLFLGRRQLILGSSNSSHYCYLLFLHIFSWSIGSEKEGDGSGCYHSYQDQEPATLSLAEQQSLSEKKMGRGLRWSCSSCQVQCQLALSASRNSSHLLSWK